MWEWKLFNFLLTLHVLFETLNFPSGKETHMKKRSGVHSFSLIS